MSGKILRKTAFRQIPKAEYLPPQFFFLPFSPHRAAGVNTRLIALARGVLTGTILDFAEKTNSFTAVKFLWLRIETLSCEMDVVTEIPNKRPKIGGLIYGGFWLVVGENNKRDQILDRLITLGAVRRTNLAAFGNCRRLSSFPESAILKSKPGCLSNTWNQLWRKN